MSAFKEFLFNNDYSYLLQIAIILLSTKLLGLLTKRISLPQVVGALAAGIILGPMLLDVVERNDLIVSLAELGVIVIMFSAGLETDIQELKKAGLASFVIALVGVIVPLLGGYFLADLYNTDQDPEMASLFWQNIFIGVVLTATSVSITVETLKELGALNSRAGNAILGAAVIDDILGIIALTVVISLGGKKSGDGESARTLGSAWSSTFWHSSLWQSAPLSCTTSSLKNGGNPATRTSSATTSSPLFSACCSPLPQSCSSVSQISPALSLPALPYPV